MRKRNNTGKWDWSGIRPRGVDWGRRLRRRVAGQSSFGQQLQHLVALTLSLPRCHTIAADLDLHEFDHLLCSLLLGCTDAIVDDVVDGQPHDIELAVDLEGLFVDADLIIDLAGERNCLAGRSQHSGQPRYQQDLVGYEEEQREAGPHGEGLSGRWHSHWR